MSNIGYQRALEMGLAEIQKLAPDEITENTGVVWNGKTFEIPWYNQLVPFEDGSIEEKIIWLHYMAAKGRKAPTGQYITYKQTPGAAIYNDNFIKRCISPMVKVFSNDLDSFLKKGMLLGGRQMALGDRSFTINVLPYIPITFIIWQGDDEVPANGNIIFDENVVDWLCAEDLVVIASLPVYKMIRMPLESA